MAKYIIKFERPSLIQRWDMPNEVRYVLLPFKSKVVSTYDINKAHKFDTKDEAEEYATLNVIATKIYLLKVKKGD